MKLTAATLRKPSNDPHMQLMNKIQNVPIAMAAKMVPGAEELQPESPAPQQHAGDRSGAPRFPAHRQVRSTKSMSSSNELFIIPAACLRLCFSRHLPNTKALDRFTPKDFSEVFEKQFGFSTDDRRGEGGGHISRRPTTGQSFR